MEIEISEQEKIVKAWEEAKIERIEMEFNCGGDSMGDTEFYIYSKSGKIKNDKIKEYFEEEVYNHVEFYVNSDGYYHGEAGTVEITLEDGEFVYHKDSMAEYSEDVSNKIFLKVDKRVIKLLTLSGILIEGDENDGRLEYEKDCVLSVKEDLILEKLINEVHKTAEGYEPVHEEGDIEEYYSYETKVVEDELIIYINNSIRVYKETDW